MVTRIAVASDDGESVSADFRMARYYMVIDVEDGRIVGRELRAKVSSPPPAPETGPRDAADHFAGHRVGAGPRSRYDEMAAAIGDCDAVLAREIATGAKRALEGYGIEPVTTSLGAVDEAVLDYLRRVHPVDG